MTARSASGPELTRRTFLAGAGSIAVSFSLLGRAAATAAGAASAKDGLVRINPVASSAAPTEHWLVLTADRITVYAGKVELGTGIQTALAQIVAEELRLEVVDLEWVQGDTRLSPTQGGTVGSKSIQNGGPELRAAAATAYAALLDLAAQHLSVSKDRLVARNGRFHVSGPPGGDVSYEKLLRTADVVTKSDEAAPVVAPADYTVVGQSVERVDLPAKVTAQFRFAHDITLPGMLHGRVVRPPGRNATAPVVGNLARAAAIPGFRQVVVEGRFIGVVAETEWAAARAAAPATGITVSWTQGPAMLAQDQLPQLLRDPVNHYRAVEERDDGDVDAAFAAPAATVVEAGYFTPFQMHAGMGASASVADVRAAPDPVTGVQATIYSGTQNVTALRGAIARLLGFTNPLAVHVLYEEASGCYGHNGADDAAADAALLSKAVGAPVRVQWTRQNEHGWEPLGAAQAHDMKGSVDGSGITGWLHRVYAPTANSRPAANNAGTLLAGALKGLLPASLPNNAGNASGRNCPVTYAFPNQRVESRLIKSFETTDPIPAPQAPLRYRIPRTTALRSLGGFSNSFANESFFDELAIAGGFDPLELRIASHTDPRARAVLEALRPSWAARPQGTPGVGAGVAYQQYENENAYVGTYLELVVDLATGAVRVTRVVCAHDCGLIVNPDGLINQIEGNIIQGISRTLKEEVLYTADRVTSVVWESNAFNPSPQYSVLRFNEVPEIESILIDRPDEPAWGAGEPAIGTLGGAIGNALFAAAGVRLRTLPMTPARVKAALDAL